MKNNKTIVLVTLLAAASTLMSQTALENASSRIGILMNKSTSFIASQNKRMILDSLRTLLSRRFVDSDYMSQFGLLMDGTFTHQDGNCKVNVVFSPGIGGADYRELITDSATLYLYDNISLEQIKADFGYKQLHGNDLDAMDIYSMLTHYPKERAMAMFNANVMVMYPIISRGDVLDNKFTRCRVVAVGKDRHEFKLYFLMTDKSALNFDNYLNDFKKIFWYTD